MIETPKKRRKPSGYIAIEGASQHNLKDIDVKVPLGVLFCCVTGVSGSGKSTLVNEVLLKAVANHLHRTRQRAGAHRRITGLEQLDKIISVDQSPIGRTPRSNPATYIGLFDQIRDLFSKTQEARARGYKPGRFSFNVKGGRCEVCRGDGQIKIEMHFLPDVYVPCEQCHGKRYNRETLEVRFKGKTIADVLEMPIEEALEFFAHIPKIRRRVEALVDVGLGYMRLGQPATTLSGGEAQRVKLAAELSKVATGRTLYILDEPTTGLHFADIQRLLEVLTRLVDAGNSVVVIEHNLDVIKVCDRLIDLGPEGGDEGGRVIATGTPEEVAAVSASYTGQFLADLLPIKASRSRQPAATGSNAKTTARNGSRASASQRSKAKTPSRNGAPSRKRDEGGQRHQDRQRRQDRQRHQDRDWQRVEAHRGQRIQAVGQAHPRDAGQKRPLSHDGGPLQARGLVHTQRLQPRRRVDGQARDRRLRLARARGAGAQVGRVAPDARQPSEVRGARVPRLAARAHPMGAQPTRQRPRAAADRPPRPQEITASSSCPTSRSRRCCVRTRSGGRGRSRRSSMASTPVRRTSNCWSSRRITRCSGWSAS